MEWQTIDFTDDTQDSISWVNVFWAPAVNGGSSSHLNMDCLGKVSVARPKGQCAVTYTYKDISVVDPKIKIHFMDEEGGDNTQGQIGVASAKDWNSMVVLTDENNYVVTFLTEILGM